MDVWIKGASIKYICNIFWLSKITHYEQRLRTLHYKKKFHIWFSEVKPKIQVIQSISPLKL